MAGIGARAGHGPAGRAAEVNVQSLPTAAITLINRVLDFAERHRDRSCFASRRTASSTRKSDRTSTPYAGTWTASWARRFR